MAEGFARAYGNDIIIPASAGLAPAAIVAGDTMRAMAEKNIDLADHFPKGISGLGRAQFDYVVNMSGWFLPRVFGDAKLIEWEVPDPVAMQYDEHREIRDVIERRVMALIVELRRPPERKLRGIGSGRLPL